MKRFTHTCYHCRTGMVFTLPSRCPECDRLLTTEIKPRTPPKEKEEGGNNVELQ